MFVHGDDVLVIHEIFSFWSIRIFGKTFRSTSQQERSRDIGDLSTPTNRCLSLIHISALPSYLAEQADEALKSSYNLEFLGIKKEVTERRFEERLVERVQRFILELGYGFCFVGRQHRLLLGSKEYYIDLLFYHRFLKALVAFELKTGPFLPEYAGKMDFYLNVLNEKERAPTDNPSIGVILCAQKDDLDVEFSLKSKANPIGVASYRLTSKLPKEFRGKLPTERQLLTVVRESMHEI